MTFTMTSDDHQMTLPLIEERKIRVPYEDVEDAIMGVLEQYGYVADNEIILDLDLGFEVDDHGLVTLDASVTWE